MKKLLSGICATSLAFAVTATGMAPAFAAPRATPETAAVPGVIKVQSSADDIIRLRRDRDDERRDWRDDRRDRREDRRDANRERQRDWREARQERRDDWRDARQDRREARRDERRDYYRGYRGYREYRPGYKRHGDYWYPAAAFVAGALITGAIANSQPREVIVERGGSHEQWCANRYRSYRAYDDSFQPYNGPRQRCISPYG